VPYCTDNEGTMKTAGKTILVMAAGILLLGTGVPEAHANGSWGSGAICAKRVKAGKRLARSAKVLRVGSWNLHGFPDGAPGKRRRGVKRTDVAWMACALAWMQLDVVALQGVKNHWRARSALNRLLGQLRRLTGARWKYKLDKCRGASRDHVGLLWNTRRVQGSKFRVEESVNPYRRACRSGQRPGLRGYFKARFGGRVDFHLLSVQLATGDGIGRKLRKRAINGLPAAYRSGRRLAPDADMIVAGDFHTGATPWLSRAVASLSTPFILTRADRQCTGYASKTRRAWSHFLVARDMVEVSSSRRARVVGYCAAARCAVRTPSPLPAAHTSLTPHCPVILDVPNKDVDPRRQELNNWATKTYTTKVGKSGLPRKLSAKMIKKVLRKLKGRLHRACRRHGSGAYTVTIIGATGKVKDVKKDGKAPTCALKVLRRAVFPRFQVSALQILMPVIW
jgi:endonuclease/exonuclease/phosphatase family metal-dependent hydrolase